MMVKNGVEETVPLKYGGTFSYLSLKGEDFNNIERELVLSELLEAPVDPGQVAGTLRYSLNGKTLGEVPVLTDGTVEEAGFRDYFGKLLKGWLM